MGVFYQLIARMLTLDHQMFRISPVLRCFRKCAKIRTFESERVKYVSIADGSTLATHIAHIYVLFHCAHN